MYCGNFTNGEYVNVLRINYAITLIRKGYLLTHTIDSLSKKTLFVIGNTFYLNFKKLMGESPSEFHAHLQLDKRGAVEA
jgi:YesN/AraC family two-component response regulator